MNSRRALCIGPPPPGADVIPVEAPPYDAVFLGSLTPGELLQMPTEAVCQALLSGIPVYLAEEGLLHRRLGGSHAPALYRELCARERYLRQLGVRLWRTSPPLLTAADVRGKAPGAIPPGARLTPLARDILEGKA